MKKLTIPTIIFLVLMIFVILIDIPENQKVKINVFGKTWETTINPIDINLNLFGFKIERKFRTKLGLDLSGGSRLVFEANTKKIAAKDQATAVEGARDIIERRINFFGVSEPNVTTLKVGPVYRITVDLPGAGNLNQAVDLIGKTAQLEFKEEASLEAKIATQAPLFVLLSKKTKLTGRDIKRSAVEFDNQGKPSVGLEFNTAGGKLFEQITERNVGKRVAIYLDDAILSAPVVQQKIIGGKAVITGDFSLEEAKKLSIAINSGALPVSIKLIEQRNIGPSLGKEQIDNSLFAGVIGLLSVVIFMIVYYRRLGITACIALAIYGLISFAVFRAIPIVLTLSGIAGFILSIGMAVDANILIFERIKEEQRLGKSFDIALRLGFARAISAIKDANITTLLVAFILYNPANWSFFPQFGLVRGFALTLAIGVATSLFTQVVITRKIINLFYKNKK
jgi:preprotein translocase subunit SecD